VPYSSVSELPDAVKKLPPKKRRQWMHVFNSVYARTQDDGRAAAAAWSAVGGKKYEEVDEMREDQDLAASVIMTLPIVKVDKEKREIVGIATSEVLDSQGEVLEYDGSKKAFGEWVGNIREMHQPKAVGRGVGVSFDDAKKRIVVRARVSKGAPDTWEKVLDGTLSHYSVGGMRLDSKKVAASELPPDSLKGISEPPTEALLTRRWRMTELSLVDAGANHEARFELVKSIDGIPTETDLVEHASGAAAEEGLLGGLEPDQVVDKVMAPGAKYSRGLVEAVIRRSRSEQLSGSPDLFYALHDVTLIKVEDVTEFRAEDGSTLELAEIRACAELMTKYGYYAMDIKAVPVDFETAYQRYVDEQKMHEVYMVTDILHGLILSIAMASDVKMAEKKKMLAESLGQFVDIFMGVVEEAHKSSAEPDLKKELKMEEDKKGTVEVKVDSKPADKAAEQPAAPVDVSKALVEAMATFSTKLEDTLAAVKSSFSESLESVAKRVEQLEEKGDSGAVVLRRHSKDGKATDMGKDSGPASVVVEDGAEMTLPEVLKAIEEAEKEIAALPFGDHKRTSLELRAFRLHRSRKVLQGQGVWR